MREYMPVGKHGFLEIRVQYLKKNSLNLEILGSVDAGNPGQL